MRETPHAVGLIASSISKDEGYQFVCIGSVTIMIVVVCVENNDASLNAWFLCADSILLLEVGAFLERIAH